MTVVTVLFHHVDTVLFLVSLQHSEPVELHFLTLMKPYEGSAYTWIKHI
jgi:hypothetical protein